MIRKGKKYAWPRKLYDSKRILEENALVETYGLKNKKEIWKTDAKVNYLRTRAKDLITAEFEEQQKFFDKLNKIGLNVKSIADVLALNKENLLRRRLATIVWKKSLAKTAQQARQMIVHKKIAVNQRVMNAPSYLVGLDEEDKISLRAKIRTKKENPGINKPEEVTANAN